eukprot:191901-Pelagomonas_calceolata.AAC.4
MSAPLSAATTSPPKEKSQVHQAGQRNGAQGVQMFAGFHFLAPCASLHHTMQPAIMYITY